MPWRAAALALLLGLVAACSAGSEPVAPGSAGGGGAGSGGAGAGGDGGASADGGASGPAMSDGGAALAADAAKPPTTYKTVTINFDDLPASTDVTTQYAAHATFSSAKGVANQTSANYDFGQSKPNYLTVYFSDGSGTSPTYLDFAAPVKGLKFRGIGVNANGKAAEMKLYKGATLAATVDLMGLGTPMTPLDVDLSKSDGITRLEIGSITDAYGIGFDDFTFDFPE